MRKPATCREAGSPEVARVGSRHKLLLLWLDYVPLKNSPMWWYLRWGFWEIIRWDEIMRVGSWWQDECPRKKRYERACWCFLYQVRTQQEGRKKALARTRPLWHPNLRLPSLQICEEKNVCCWRHPVYGTLSAAWADYYGHLEQCFLYLGQWVIARSMGIHKGAKQ